MDGERFDRMTKNLAVGTFGRRRVLRGLAGAGLGLLLARIGVSAAAEETIEADNQFGCVRVGRRCRKNRQCCSGICKGRKGKETCRPHNVGTCKRSQNVCGPVMQVARCNNSDDCGCFVTTGGASFCGGDRGECMVCRDDRDCQARGFGQGAACVVCREECPDTGTGCLVPCGG